MVLCCTRLVPFITGCFLSLRLFSPWGPPMNALFPGWWGKPTPIFLGNSIKSQRAPEHGPVVPLISQDMLFFSLSTEMDRLSVQTGWVRKGVGALHGLSQA